MSESTGSESPIVPFVDGGRDTLGRFKPGNPGGPGNPHARRVAELREAMLTAVTPGDIKAIIEKLVALAKEGHVPAIRELLERVLGAPLALDVLERLENLERLLAAHAKT